MNQTPLLKPEKEKTRSIIEKLSNLENSYKSYLSILYFFIIMIFSTIIINIKNYFFAKIVLIQYFYINFLISFLINYIFIRKYLINPTMPDKSDNYIIKKSAFCFLLSLFLIIYLVNNSDFKLINFPISMIWIFLMTFEKIFYNEEFRKTYIFSGFLVILGNIFIHFDIFDNLNIQNNLKFFSIKLILCFFSIFLFSYSITIASKTKIVSSIAISHIYLFILVIYFPISFGIIDGIDIFDKINFNAILFNILSGFFLELVFILFFKSLTLFEKTSVLMMFLNFGIIFQNLLEICLGKSNSKYESIGIFIIFFALLLLIYNIASNKIVIGKLFTRRDSRKKTNIEMKIFYKKSSHI